MGFGSYYHLIISLTTTASLNFYKKSLVYAEQFIFQTMSGCLISMHLQYNSSRNREYRLILQFVIRGVEHQPTVEEINQTTTLNQPFQIEFTVLPAKSDSESNLQDRIKTASSNVRCTVQVNV